MCGKKKCSLPLYSNLCLVHKVGTPASFEMNLLPSRFKLCNGHVHIKKWGKDIIICDSHDCTKDIVNFVVCYKTDC